jgi:hypothetical protein
MTTTNGDTPKVLVVDDSIATRSPLSEIPMAIPGYRARRVSAATMILSSLAMNMGWSLPGLGPGVGPVRPTKTCLLPGCNIRHKHNGGYCSADHCREHRLQLKRGWG